MQSIYGDGRPVVPASDAASILLRLKTLLTTAQKVCEEYAEGWLQPHHLLGGVCNEEHRQLVAAHVLLSNGMEQELQEAMATAVPVGVGGRVSAISAKHLLHKQGWVQEELKRRLTAATYNSVRLRKWGLAGGSNREQHEGRLAEWIHLAVTPPLAEGYAFTQEACPDLFKAFITLLFVGFSDNTPLVCTPPHHPHDCEGGGGGAGTICQPVPSGLRPADGLGCAGAQVQVPSKIAGGEEGETDTGDAEQGWRRSKT